MHIRKKDLFMGLIGLSMMLGRWEMPEYRLKTPALARKVVGLYRKIEQGTVLAYKKIEDRFVDAFLEKVENAAQKEDEEAQADAGTRD